ncbi:hypothetical protein ABT294_26755 [Nonomuraea sp. NPDC000554]|uniref:hypothetical protein n=1 Tax=Nonomuraea sp. NPDC000554 TaxID=3154259 RepID=UPI0033336A11
MMRRRPSICDACDRLDPDRRAPSCEAFPDGIPTEIHLGGFDHRRPYRDDRGVLFVLRDGGERALRAYEIRRSLSVR